MHNLLSETYNNLISTDGVGALSDKLKEKEFEKKVYFVPKSQLIGAKGYIFASESLDIITLIETDEETENETNYYAVNVLENPKMALSDLLGSFHTVLGRKDDLIVFDSKDIEYIKEKQIGKEGINPIHVSDLGIFLTQEDIAEIQMKLIEEKELQINAKETENATLKARIAELELEAEQKKSKKDKPTE